MNTMYDYVPYPELYYAIQSKVQETMTRYFGDYPTSLDISKNEIDSLIDEVYNNMLNEYSEIEDDLDEIEKADHTEQQRLRPFYGRRRLLRDAVSIILIGDLLGRGFGYPGYGYSGYGYPGGYGYPYGPEFIY